MAILLWARYSIAASNRVRGAAQLFAFSSRWETNSTWCSRSFQLETSSNDSTRSYNRDFWSPFRVNRRYFRSLKYSSETNDRSACIDLKLGFNRIGLDLKYPSNTMATTRYLRSLIRLITSNSRSLRVKKNR